MTSGENNENGMPKSGYASRGTANTALGFGIAGTALGLGAMGLFGARNPNGNPPAGPAGPYSPFVGVREFYNYALGQADKRYDDYKGFRDMSDILLQKIADVNTKVDVIAATTPLIVENEAIRRKAGDQIIVTYCNGTFMPEEIADVTIGTTASKQSIYNPLAQLL